uniref:Uncharacterized protein n=1 Tax=Dictyoglomus turgidum TaxID=513050 RepID=A0A7C3WLE6_9BACT
MGKNDDILKKIEEINKKVKDLETKKIRAEQELKFLQDQYNETIEELRKNGIDDVQNIPDMIISLEKEIDDMISNIESQILQIEQKLQSISD